MIIIDKEKEDKYKETQKLCEKSKIYVGSTPLEILIDMEAGVTALCSQFLNVDEKKMKATRDRIIKEVNDAKGKNFTDKFMEAIIVLSIFTMKLKQQNKLLEKV